MRPESGGSTLTSRAGSASTTAGSTRVRSIVFSTTGSMMSLFRSGEPSGISIRCPFLMRLGTLRLAAEARKSAAVPAGVAMKRYAIAPSPAPISISIVPA